jgi:serine/threonine protein kinase
MILLKMVNGNYDQFWNIHKKNKQAGFYTPEFMNLIEGLLQFDPSKRLTIEQIKAHSWYNQPTLTHE